MTRRLPPPARRRTAMTLTCWPEGTLTFWRQGATLAHLDDVIAAETPWMMAGATSLRTPSTYTSPPVSVTSSVRSTSAF